MHSNALKIRIFIPNPIHSLNFVLYFSHENEFKRLKILNYSEEIN
jgi:hypothetical protein